MLPLGINPFTNDGFPWQLVIFVGLVMFIKTYMQGASCPKQYKVTDKLIVITGGNSGVGKQTALELAQRGGRIIIACRDPSKGQLAANEIKELSKNDRIDVMELDLASFESIRKFAKEFDEKEDHLDILINNAGIMFHPEAKSSDGNELHFQSNYLGHFMLTLLLLDKLRAAPEARVINVTALAHFATSMKLEDVNMEREEYVPRTAYGRSKLAQVFFTKELARKLEGTRVTVNCLHPGIVRGTELARFTPLASGFFRAIMFPLLWVLTKSPKNGCQTSVYVASCPELKDVTGQYFSDCEIKKPSAESQSKEMAKKLWNLSLKMVDIEEERLNLVM